jgi:hypothetical protein
MGDEAYHEESGEAASRDPSLEDVANLCRELNDGGANYVVVGGFAIILHGYPRGTTDIDFLVVGQISFFPGSGMSCPSAENSPPRNAQL